MSLPDNTFTLDYMIRYTKQNLSFLLSSLNQNIQTPTPPLSIPLSASTPLLQPTQQSVMNIPFSSTSFDAKTSNMHISTTPSAGCLVGLIRRFFTPSQSHQSDHETTSLQSDNHPHNFKSKHNGTDSPGPNLVARLMGLDPMLPHKPQKPILRSRSMDYDQLQEEGQGKHRRLRTSVSFREMPTYLYQENDEYLVLSFEDEMRSCEKKKTKQETEEYMLNRRSHGNGGTIVDSTTTSPPSVAVAPKRRTRKKKKRSTIHRLEAECSSEDSSPVSVLDRFPTEEGSRSSSRRKLEPKLGEYQEPSTTRSIDEETNAKQKEQESESESYRDVWGSVCRLADPDMVMQPHWSLRKACTFEDLGHVYQDLEVQILDQLFHELVLQF